MEQFKQLFTVVGTRRTVTGQLLVSMNYKTKTVRGTHAITHDDYQKQIKVHKIEIFINAELVGCIEELETENIVLGKVETAIANLKAKMATLASTEATMVFSDKMEALGFRIA